MEESGLKDENRHINQENEEIKRNLIKVQYSVERIEKERKVNNDTADKNELKRELEDFMKKVIKVKSK